jgi:hypothetical protein
LWLLLLLLLLPPSHSMDWTSMMQIQRSVRTGWSVNVSVDGDSADTTLVVVVVVVAAAARVTADSGGDSVAAQQQQPSKWMAMLPLVE